mmetsp:Transcript_12812/g.26464  ORF Transcript_12812/g.26464 Transcript_12812/m.26464 type:complete len:238 (-) Transcript_12812:43-756(-)
MIQVARSAVTRGEIAAVSESLLLVVEKDEVLMEEEGGEHVVEPDRHRQREERHASRQLSVAVLDEHLTPDVPRPARRRRRGIQNQHPLTPVAVLAADADEARWAVVDRVGGSCRVFRVAVDTPRKQASLAGLCFRRDDNGLLFVPVPSQAVVRDGDVCRIQYVLHKEVPPVRQITHVPCCRLNAPFQSRVQQLRNESRGCQCALNGCVTARPARLSPHPQKPLRLLQRILRRTGLGH